MTGPAKQLTPTEVKTMMDAGTAYVIDVREPNEYAEAHIDGVALMPLSGFDPGSVKPPEGTQIVFHCRSGQRCGMASEAMRTAGYTGPISRMTGGMLAWVEAGLPVARNGNR